MVNINFSYDLTINVICFFVYSASSSSSYLNDLSADHFDMNWSVDFFVKFIYFVSFAVVQRRVH